jgi:hypothetical protein
MMQDEMNAEEGENNIEFASKTADPPDVIMISRPELEVNTRTNWSNVTRHPFDPPMIVRSEEV